MTDDKHIKQRTRHRRKRKRPSQRAVTVFACLGWICLVIGGLLFAVYAFTTLIGMLIAFLCYVVIGTVLLTISSILSWRRRMAAEGAGHSKSHDRMKAAAAPKRYKRRRRVRHRRADPLLHETQET